jgi:membrane dipeptidase
MFQTSDRLTPTPSRRALLTGMAGGALVAAAGLPWAGARAQTTARAYSAATTALMERALVIDMLAPLSLDFTRRAWSDTLDEIKAEDFRASGITGFHNSYGLGGMAAHAQALQYFAAWNGFAGRNSDLFTLVARAEDIPAAKAAGKCAIIMGVQNSDHFRDADDVELFYDLGQRCSQLTYNSQNFLGSGATDRVDGGVTTFGASIIERMNRVGMLIDVSHCGDRTTLDAIEISQRPIAITHSNARALNDHPRLKTDEAIRALAAKGGVFGVTGVRNFVRGHEPTDTGHIADHIDHVVQMTGIEHAGVGSDADLYGYDQMDPAMNARLRAAYTDSYAFRERLDTDGFDHPRKFFDLTEALLRRGYSDDDVLLVLGGNFQRLMAEIWSENDVWRARHAEEEETSRGEGEQNG